MPLAPDHPGPWTPSPRLVPGSPGQARQRVGQPEAEIAGLPPRGARLGQVPRRIHPHGRRRDPRAGPARDAAGAAGLRSLQRRAHPGRRRNPPGSFPCTAELGRTPTRRSATHAAADAWLSPRRPDQARSSSQDQPMAGIGLTLAASQVRQSRSRRHFLTWGRGGRGRSPAACGLATGNGVQLIVSDPDLAGTRDPLSPSAHHRGRTRARVPL